MILSLYEDPDIGGTCGIRYPARQKRGPPGLSNIGTIELAFLTIGPSGGMKAKKKKSEIQAICKFILIKFFKILNK